MAPAHRCYTPRTSGRDSVRSLPFLVCTAPRRWYTRPAMTPHPTPHYAPRPLIAVLFAVAWTLAWVATGVALSMAR